MNPPRDKMKGDNYTVPLANAVLMDLVDSVEELGRKPYGWDGPLSLPVRQDVKEELIGRLLGTYGMDLRGLRGPEVTTGHDGTISVIFRHDRKHLLLHVLCARVVRCVAVSEGKGVGFEMDKVVRLPKGTPATGYAAEIDEWANWLLGLEEIG